ncbi:MAG: HDOD domain-containing protein [Thermodesulfobacteriota bacterium]|nr:HDOD domain-containing protein [Thermodesulfobacteriota bacterium]
MPVLEQWNHSSRKSDVSMMKERVKQLINFIEEFPTLPAMFGSILQTIDNDDACAKDLEVLVSKDQVITAKVLKLANSSFFGLSGQISTIKRAIILLGFNMVKSLTLSIPVFDLIAQKKKNNLLNWEKFWIHAFGSALMAKIFEEKILY